MNEIESLLETGNGKPVVGTVSKNPSFPDENKDSRMKTTKENHITEEKTQRINKQTNKPNKNKNKTNKRTSSIVYEKTVSSYQQSVAPRPPNPIYPT